MTTHSGVTESSKTHHESPAGPGPGRGASRRTSNMLVPTIIMAALAIVLVVIGHRRGGGSEIQGLKFAFVLLAEMLPLLVFALIVAGMIQVLVPKELLARWVGAESGMRGILLGTVAGGLSPGGPYVNLPLAAGLMQAGASVGTMVAFLTGWSLWAVSRLPMEVGLLGWKLTAIRVAATFFFPPIAGLLAQRLFGGVRVF
ncbi:MAG: permease [Candidatus Eisenbacteria bacterium]|nr:permease [Candidatus Eisenbacteria bacterium]